MDFLKMNFSELFLEKHGKKTFDNICELIKKENPSKYNENYISFIFKLAFLDFFGLTSKQIKGLVEDLQIGQNVDVKELKKVHKDSIKEIKKCLNSVMPK